MRTRFVLTMIAAMLTVAAPSAKAAVTESYPGPAQREVAASLQGWTPTTVDGGVCLLPILLCPAVVAEYGPTGGAGGAGDGYLHGQMATVVGLLSTGDTVFTSPTFTPAAPVQSATLQFDRRSDVGALLSLGGSVASTYTLIDVTAGTRTAIATAVPVTASPWTTVSAGAVPAGAFVAGHTYRLELRTTFTTPVSVATGGSVDFDRVQLTTSRLTPPTGLTTPVVQIDTDGIRVTGTVDPQGLPTSVRAEYGPTTAYGTQTGPQMVTGSGAQSYTIPLAGLTPGQLYHLRVAATSSDGTATSNDLTFTAPALPPNGPPTVDGSAQLRTRTVTFDRPAGVLAATVEILSGGSVVDTVAVPSGSSTTITLPDADGTYGVRVLRTTGSGSTTSPTTQVTLDRQAPSTAGLNLDVLPRTAAVRERTATFVRPTDAQTVTAQIIDAGDQPVGASTPVTGSTVAVTLPATDGAYRLQLTLTDAAGNASTATGPVLTLDTQAPVAGPAPTVTGTENALNRGVSFTRAGDTAFALVEVLDASDTVVATAATTTPDGDTATVTLPAVDGAYRVRVLQVDASGNGSRTPTTAVSLDRTPPNPGPAPDVTGASNDRPRTVTFVRAADVADAEVEIVDANGTLVGMQAAVGATAAISLPDTDGTYTVRVRVSDALGNTNVTPSTTVVLDRAAPNAGAAPTVTGPGNARGRGVTFTRAGDAATVTVEILDASATVVDTVTVASGSSTSITLPDADGTYRVRVSQRDAAGNVDTTPSTTVTLDRSAPDAGAAPTVAGAGNDRSRTVTFDRAPDAATAAVEILSGGAVVDTVAVPSGASATITLPNADGAYAVRVRQTDASTNTAVTPSTAVTLDRSAPNAGPAPSVTGPGNDRNRTVGFDRAGDAATVAVEIVDAGGTVVDTVAVPSGGTAAIALPATDGTYTVRVRQTDAAGNAAVTPSTTVTLDRAAPNAGGAPTVTGPGTSRARAVSFDRAGDAATVAVEIVDGGGTVVGTVAVPSGGSATVTLPDTDGTYEVRVRQTDAAGNAAVTPSTTVTLDRVAPDAGPAPSVTGATDDRSRTVTFTRAPDAATVAVEILDGGTVIDTVAVPSGPSAAITLSNADGTYTVRVRQVDSTGNAATTPATTIELDRGAPDPGPAPTVTGPGNARERTVTFDRAPDAATVTVEILDGLVVLDSVTVPTGGTAAITLPDADGTYAIRVRQADVDGNAAITPRTTVTLDRGAPDAGPAPTVTGPGNARERTVTFDRAPDAATVTVEILGAGGTVVDTVAVPSGSSATITLPSADGTYGIRVRQADADGNAAASPQATATLDRTPPAAGPAPSVTGAGNDRPRTVTFDRAPDATTVTVEILRDGAVIDTVAVPSGSSATVTLPNTDGTYDIRVRQVDADGNAAVTASTSVTLDRTPVTPQGTTPDPTPAPTANPTPAPGGNGPVGVLGTGTQPTPTPSVQPITTPGGIPSDPDKWTGTPPAGDPGSAAFALASCESGGVSLTRLRISGGRVRAYGVTRFAAGVPLLIRDATGKALARTTVDAAGKFQVSFPTGDLPQAARLTRLYAQSYSVRSRALRLQRANELSGVRVSRGLLTVSGTLNPQFRKGRVSFTVVGGRKLGGCTKGRTMKSVGVGKLDPRTGRYTLRVRAPKGTGYIILRVRARNASGTTFSNFAVR